MRKLTAILLSAALTLGSALTATAHDYSAGDIGIAHPWTRATPPNANVGGGYMTLENNGSAADRLVSASSPIAQRVEIHLMELDGDVMRMRQVTDGVALPAGEDVALEPGGYHLMLIGLDEPLREGDRVPLTLEFEAGGTAEVELAVEPMGAGNAADSHGGH